MSEEIVKKPFYKKWWVWLIAVFIVIAIASSVSEDAESVEPASTEAENKEENLEDTEEPEEESEKIEEEEEVEEVEPEPEPIPDPIVYEGNGDDVLKIEKPEDGPIVLIIKGNSNAGHFAVKGFDDNDGSTELFVNTTDPYEGITLDPSGETSILEISSNGSWTIESISVRSVRSLETPGKIEGVGDEVLLVEGSSSIANITGNKSESHFAVKSYNPNRNLLVNTTDVYEGSTRVEKDTFLIEVIGVGDWSIELE